MFFYLYSTTQVEYFQDIANRCVELVALGQMKDEYWPPVLLNIGSPNDLAICDPNTLATFLNKATVSAIGDLSYQGTALQDSKSFLADFKTKKAVEEERIKDALDELKLNPKWADIAKVSIKDSNPQPILGVSTVPVIVDQKSKKLYFLKSADLYPFTEYSVSYGGKGNDSEKHKLEWLEETAGFFNYPIGPISADPIIQKLHTEVAKVMNDQSLWEKDTPINTDFVKGFFWRRGPARECVLFFPIEALGKIDGSLKCSTLNQQEANCSNKSTDYHERKNYSLVEVQTVYNALKTGWPKNWRKTWNTPLQNNVWDAINAFLGTQPYNSNQFQNAWNETKFKNPSPSTGNDV